MILKDEQLLLVPSVPVATDEVDSLLKLLAEELDGSPEPGIGLAAPQIGIYKKAFIIRALRFHRYDFVNPELLSLRSPLIFTREGCLSYPGKQVKTLRYNVVTIKDDLHQEPVTLSGLPAVAAQHEYDHILGISMFDRQLSKIEDENPCPCSSGLTFSKCCKITLRKDMRIA